MFDTSQREGEEVMRRLVVAIVVVFVACLVTGCGTLAPIGEDRLPDKTPVGGQVK